MHKKSPSLPVIVVHESLLQRPVLQRPDEVPVPGPVAAPRGAPEGRAGNGVQDGDAAPVDSFPIAVGRAGTETPTGRFQVEEKIEHPDKKISHAHKPKKATKVIDLVAVLQQSLAQTKGGAKEKKASAKKPAQAAKRKKSPLKKAA